MTNKKRIDLLREYWGKEVVDNIITAIWGSLIGLCNGFCGGGGGMVCVPILEEYFKYDEKKSHATTLCVILPLCIFSSFVYIFENNLDFLELMFVAFGSILGSLIGAFFLKKISGKLLKVIFAILMFCFGVKLVIF